MAPDRLERALYTSLEFVNIFLWVITRSSYISAHTRMYPLQASLEIRTLEYLSSHETADFRAHPVPKELWIGVRSWGWPYLSRLDGLASLNAEIGFLYSSSPASKTFHENLFTQNRHENEHPYGVGVFMWWSGADCANIGSRHMDASSMGVFDNEGYSRFRQMMDEAQAFSIVYGAFPIAKKPVLWILRS